MKPVYAAKPIATIDSLAAALFVDREVLLDFSESANSKYSHFQIPKKDGKQRNICAPHHDLKILQRRINTSIFSLIQYPDYLYGGIPGRDYVKNAEAHSHAKSAIALDIKTSIQQ